MPVHSYSHMNTLHDLRRGQRHGTAIKAGQCKAGMGEAWGHGGGTASYPALAGQGKVGQQGSEKLKAISIVLQSVGSIFRDTPGKTQQSG